MRRFSAALFFSGRSVSAKDFLQHIRPYHERKELPGIRIRSFHFIIDRLSPCCQSEKWTFCQALRQGRESRAGQNTGRAQFRVSPGRPRLPQKNHGQACPVWRLAYALQSGTSRCHALAEPRFVGFLPAVSRSDQESHRCEPTEPRPIVSMTEPERTRGDGDDRPRRGGPRFSNRSKTARCSARASSTRRLATRASCRSSGPHREHRQRSGGRSDRRGGLLDVTL